METPEEIKKVIKASYYWGRDYGDGRSDKNLNDLMESTLVKDLLASLSPKEEGENKEGVESVLLSTCSRLDSLGAQMYEVGGTESYVERCHNHDAKMLIYGLTNKSRKEKKTYTKWLEEIQKKL